MKTETISDRKSNLSLKERPIDIFFMIIFSVFILTSCIADMIPTLGIDFNQPSSNFIVNANYWYAEGTDPLFQNPPMWMRIVTGLSAFVYMPFYIILVISLAKGWNNIQLPAVIYATMIAGITGIVVFGVEFFGEPEWRTPNPAKFLMFNSPYVLIPILLLIRMRKQMPFTRKF
ncbi:MAG: DUF2781 domain-containing protein [Bacteroidales bacterium]|jgi:hypothetical protein|nr:DUF2781 domain-containing protein [Bacteroidales bacterium]